MWFTVQHCEFANVQQPVIVQLGAQDLQAPLLLLAVYCSHCSAASVALTPTALIEWSMILAG